MDLIWPCIDKKNPLPMEEELMMEALCLLKKDKKVLPLLPTVAWL